MSACLPVWQPPTSSSFLFKQRPKPTLCSDFEHLAPDCGKLEYVPLSKVTLQWRREREREIEIGREGGETNGKKVDEQVVLMVFQSCCVIGLFLPCGISSFTLKMFLKIVCLNGGWDLFSESLLCQIRSGLREHNESFWGNVFRTELYIKVCHERVRWECCKNDQSDWMFEIFLTQHKSNKWDWTGINQIPVTNLLVYARIELSLILSPDLVFMEFFQAEYWETRIFFLIMLKLFW